MQVAQFHRVRVAQSERSHARGGEVYRARAPEASAADDEDARGAQRALDARAVGTQHQVSRVFFHAPRVVSGVQRGGVVAEDAILARGFGFGGHGARAATPTACGAKRLLAALFAGARYSL